MSDKSDKRESWKNDAIEISLRWRIHRREKGGGTSYDDFIEFADGVGFRVQHRHDIYLLCLDIEHSARSRAMGLIFGEVAIEKTVYPPAQPIKRKPKVNKLIARDGRKCKYCECDLIFTDEIENYEERLLKGDRFPNLGTLDHVTPRSRGGSNRLENLVLCCLTCNSSKGNRAAPKLAQKVKNG